MQGFMRQLTFNASLGAITLLACGAPNQDETRVNSVSVRAVVVDALKVEPLLVASMVRQNTIQLFPDAKQPVETEIRASVRYPGFPPQATEPGCQLSDALEFVTQDSYYRSTTGTGDFSYCETRGGPVDLFAPGEYVVLSYRFEGIQGLSRQFLVTTSITQTSPQSNLTWELQISPDGNGFRSCGAFTTVNETEWVKIHDQVLSCPEVVSHDDDSVYLKLQLLSGSPGLAGLRRVSLFAQRSFDLVATHTAFDGATSSVALALSDDATDQSRSTYHGALPVRLPSDGTAPQMFRIEARSQKDGAVLAQTSTTVAHGVACSELIAGWNAPEADQINLVFSGIGYSMEETRNLALEIVNDPEGLFSYVPFQGNKTKFNFWLAPPSELPAFPDQAAIHKQAATHVNTCPFEQRYGQVFVNSTKIGTRAGTGPKSTTVFRSYKNPSHRLRVAVHEIGHSVGRLMDEYYSSRGFTTAPRAHRNGLSGGPDLIGNAETFSYCEEMAPWRTMLGAGCGDPEQVDCIEGFQFTPYMWVANYDFKELPYMRMNPEFWVERGRDLGVTNPVGKKIELPSVSCSYHRPQDCVLDFQGFKINLLYPQVNLVALRDAPSIDLSDLGFSWVPDRNGELRVQHTGLRLGAVPRAYYRSPAPTGGLGDYAEIILSQPRDIVCRPGYEGQCDYEVACIPGGSSEHNAWRAHWRSLMSTTFVPTPFGHHNEHLIRLVLDEYAGRASSRVFHPADRDTDGRISMFELLGAGGPVAEVAQVGADGGGYCFAPALTPAPGDSSAQTDTSSTSSCSQAFFHPADTDFDHRISLPESAVFVEPLADTAQSGADNGRYCWEGGPIFVLGDPGCPHPVE